MILAVYLPGLIVIPIGAAMVAALHLDDAVTRWWRSRR